ncbi:MULTISPECIES: GtrA family protein [Clostridium]|uniref:GtrA family protein n=1 Tax=Clostridium TaxID=1485 RepID=UPI0012E4A842|nr:MULTISPECIES: GtrA family protein [Clostridium]MBS4781311.1 GtrA family protein [Clostridium sp.]CAI3245647.1 GtrA domain-containing protein [Clostridium neonatale]SUQ54959.1 Arabinogalactan biosynthesis recruiting protein [Clostridium neonatale]
MINKFNLRDLYRYEKIIKFILSGSVSTSIDLCIYMILSSEVNIILSKIISTTIACIISLIINKNWTFQYNKNMSLILILKYIIVQIINIICNVTTNTIIYKITQEKLISFIIATLCAMIVNFLLQKYYVFIVKED